MQLARNTLEYKTESFTDTKQKIQELLKQNPILEDQINRLCFYILRRYFIEIGQSSLQGKAKEFDDYIENIIKTLKEYKKVRSSTYTDKPNPSMNKSVNISNAYWNKLVLSANATKIPIRDSSIDVIVTDPPYGYATDTSEEDLYATYTSFFEQAFRVLKDEGRIVISVLDRVKTGKKINTRIRTPGFKKIISKIAKEKKIHFIIPDIPLSSESRSYFYWKSDHALNRTIISLQIKKTPDLPSFRPTYEQPLEEDNEELKNKLSIVQELRKKDLDLSIKKALFLLENYPNNSAVLRELAHNYQSKGMYGKAAYLIHQALEINNKDVEALFFYEYGNHQ